MATQTAILKGSLSLRKLGAVALLSTGNSTKISLSQEVEEKTIPNMQNPGGGNNDIFKRPKSIKVSIAFRGLTKQIMEIVFGAKVTVVAAAAVADEAHADILRGSLIVTAARQDMSAALVVKKGATVCVEGRDYQRVRAGIIPLAGVGSVLADGDDVTLDYAGLASVKIDGMMITAGEYYGLFDGIDERHNAPLIGEFYRMMFGPAKNVELVGDDFVSFECEAEVLADDTKGAAESPFYSMEISGTFS